MSLMILFVIVVLLTAVIQCVYTAFLMHRILSHKAPKIQNSIHRKVTVLICARNEAHNLRRYLPGILQQEYPDYEVLVVDDHSTDSTQEVLADFSLRFPHLKFIRITEAQKQYPGKKGALDAGIAVAGSDLLLLTDADCQVSSDQWIRLMTAPLQNDEADLVLGISPYFKAKGLVNNLVRYETMLTAMQYIGLALADKPYMGVGRNMAYTRILYYTAKGFEDLSKTLSGDDDLFVQKVKAYAKLAVVTDDDSFTWSASPTNISAWWKQKTRHYSTGIHYKQETLWPIGLFLASKFLFYTSAVKLMLSFPLEILVGLVFFHILHSIMVKPLALKLKTYDILWKSLFLDLLFIVTVLTAGAGSLLNTRYKWK